MRGAVRLLCAGALALRPRAQRPDLSGKADHHRGAVRRRQRHRLIARIIGAAVLVGFNQSVVVENKAGASGVLAAT